MTVQPTRDQLRALADAATPGPWKADTDRYTGSAVIDPDGSPIAWDEDEGEVFTEADAEFIAAARNTLPALLDALDQAEARIRAVEDVLDRWELAPDAHRPFRVTAKSIRRALDGER